MAKKSKRRSKGTPLHRSCGAMAAHMMLLERYPSFRAAQMRLEDATSRRRDSAADLSESEARHHQDSRQRRVQDGRAEHLRRADRQPDQGPEQGLPRHQPGQERDAGAVEGTGHRLTHAVQARQGHAHQDSANDFSFDDAVKKAATEASRRSAQDAPQLLGLRAAGGLLGYAQFPGGPPCDRRRRDQLQGLRHDGTAEEPFHQGRTATHEVGHYFNLRHIWGDTADCSGSDMVADTPNCAGPNTGMPAYPHVTCNNGPNGDMFVNYMDYTDDAACSCSRRSRSCACARRSTPSAPV